MPRLVRARALLMLAPLAACTSPSPVQWSDLSVDTRGMAARSAENDQHRPHGVAGMCQTSVRTTDAPNGRYAVWWRARADSSVVLEAAYSTDSGRTWRPAVTVDTVDHTRTGCERPAPAIAAERDNVHIAYSLHGPEGTGVFFAHSMDRGALFHAPVSIVYGDHLTDAAIAAQGDRVLIAYVDPNTRPTQVALAISNTQGHNFEPRLSASEGPGEKFAPAVTLNGDTLRLTWRQSQTAADSANASVVTRRGQLR